MRWELWVDYLRNDGDGLTHASTRNASEGVTLRVGEHIVVGEEAGSAVARVVSTADDGVVLVAVLPGPSEAHGSLLGQAPGT